MNDRRRCATALGVCLALLALDCKPKAAGGTLLVAGSTTLQSYMTPVVAAFQKKNPGVTVVCEPGGTTAGLVALKRGAIDVAMIGRDVEPDEDDIQLRDYLIGRDGLAIIVAPENPIQGLTHTQLYDIYSGNVEDWKDVGGPAGRIAAYTRDKTAQVRKSFGDLVLQGVQPAPSVMQVDTPQKMISTIKANPLAIGFLPLRRMSKEVRAIPIDGVPMTRATLLSGRYPLSRSHYLALYLKPTKLAEDFVSFTVGKEGAALLEEGGMVPAY